jgi:hypothetical protein
LYGLGLGLVYGLGLGLVYGLGLRDSAGGLLRFANRPPPPRVWFRVSGFGFRVYASSTACMISGFGFRVSGFGFTPPPPRVWFWVLDSGLRVHLVNCVYG